MGSYILLAGQVRGDVGSGKWGVGEGGGARNSDTVEGGLPEG